MVMNIVEIPVEREMKTSYLEYAMSVIIGRALPDVRDGLKPVHRRIIYSMLELGNTYNKPHKKSARVVGEVLGKYHPHGDAAIYESLVRMAQDFSMRYPLVDGHGNFGSIDGDPPAAMRYTEVRLSKIANELVADIDKDTVDFVPNFDGSLKEPVVLPTRIPNLLINGSSGIAVGMSTNIPPHNLNEIVDALIALLHNPNMTVEELMSIVHGPDFPTGGVIVGRSGIVESYTKGRGIISVRGKARVDEKNNQIIITELPYQVNKSELLEQIAELVKKKKLPDITGLKDLSSRGNIEVVISVRKGVNPEIVLNQLYFHTDLEKTFGVINTAIVNGVPRTLNLREMLMEFLKFRKEVITRRCRFELKNALDRKHIVEGLMVALNNIDDVIDKVRKSKDPKEAREYLMQTYSLSERQANAILEMRLSRLTALERHKLEDEINALNTRIEELNNILSNESVLKSVIERELNEIKEKYGDERRTEIIDQPKDMVLEQLIPNKRMVITITRRGYIKRVPLEEYRTQKRGGKGIIATETREEDAVVDVLVADNHDYLLVFSDKGILRWLKVYRIPETGRYAVGKPLAALLEMPADEKITATLKISNLDQPGYLVFVTERGIIKRTRLSAYSKVRKGGIIGLKLLPNDKLVSVRFTDGNRHILIATERGYCIKINESDVREMGRVAIGVHGIRLRGDDRVVGMVINDGDTVFTVTENGYGKRSKMEDYRLQHRGGKGIINVPVDTKTGKVVDVAAVNDSDELLFITSAGRSIRIRTKDVRVMGRYAHGVRIMRLGEGERITSMSRIRTEELE